MAKARVWLGLIATVALITFADAVNPAAADPGSEMAGFYNRENQRQFEANEQQRSNAQRYDEQSRRMDEIEREEQTRPRWGSR